jgi:hypothetical protein
LRWDLEITLAPGAKARSIQVRQLLPIPEPAYGINVWTARADFPTTIERLGGLDLQYGEVCYGTLLPSLTLYRRDLGVGLTVTKPFAFRTSRLSFEFMDYREPGISLNTSMLALRPDQPARTSFVFHAHEPCWRSGLAWLYQNNPTYFDPPNPAVREYEGGYTMGHPFMTGSEIDSMLPHQLRWSELHCHFPGTVITCRMKTSGTPWITTGPAWRLIRSAVRSLMLPPVRRPPARMARSRTMSCTNTSRP